MPPRDPGVANGKKPADGKADPVAIAVPGGGDNHHPPPTFTMTNGWRLPAAASASAKGKEEGRRKTTGLEKFLLASTLALGAALIAAIVVAVTGRGRGGGLTGDAAAGEVCNTAGCVKAANILLSNMDDTVDPCDDFYLYACGGFEKRSRIPDDRTSLSQFALLSDELEEQLRDILEEGLIHPGMDPAKAAELMEALKNGPVDIFRKTRDEYVACMDVDRLEELGLRPLQDMLEVFGGWPAVVGDKWKEDKFNWSDVLLKFRENGFSTDYLFDFAVSTDVKNSSYRALQFDQATLGMDREYLIKGMDNEDVGHYYNFMQKTAVLLGADPARAAKEMRAALEFELRLANITLPQEERRNATELYHPMALAEMASIAPIVDDWTAFINALLTKDVVQVSADERVIVSSPDYFRNLTALVKAEPKRNVANYFLWRTARSALPFLNAAARAVGEEFVRNMTGKTEPTPRWKGCVDAAAGSFSAAVGKLYVQKHFKQDAKEVMMEMVADIKAEFSKILDDVTWMDEETRARARKKLSTIRDYIAYPEEILDNAKLEELYQGLEISPGEYFLNGVNMSIWSTNYHWRKLREKIDKTEWKRHANPAVVNAFYSAIENSILFPAGILQGTFFNKERPMYMNYGGIGWVIGHEITHGFDDQGRQYDDEGNLANWWNEETTKEFVKKTECIIEQYGNFTARQINIRLNGINTQGENIADNAGLEEAYRAYAKWVQRHGQEQVLPGLSSLNTKQLFWLSAANTWCYKMRPKALEQNIKVGVHSPGDFRTKGPMMNSPDFTRDFGCKPGSPMNPVNKCQVW